MSTSTFEQRRRGRPIYTDENDGARYFTDTLGQRVYEHANGDVPTDPDWPQLGKAAFYGLPGKVVAALGPHTEADPAALLLTFLVAFGVAVNGAPHAVADGADHPARLFAVFVGRTSRARKGTAWQNVRRLMAVADPEFIAKRVKGGLASGEGLIAAVGDGVPDKDGNLVGAVADKRLLVYEPEFARVLKVCNREGNTLSPVEREAWDSGDLSNLTKSPMQATGTHIGLVGHITREELRKLLTETEAASGYGNRHLLAAARRSQRLPSGIGLDESEVYELGRTVRVALEKARKIGILHRSEDAEELWADLYLAIDDDVDGMVGALTARAEAQLLRLSVAYALADGSRTIEMDHLRAAHAVWRYCEDTVRYVFGDSLGDEVADRLLAAIRRAGPAGLTHAEQSGVFGRHQTAKRLAQARDLLLDRGLIVAEKRPTEGRDAVVNIAVEHAKHAKHAKEGSNA
jgi:hypothetical protein